MAKSSRRVKGLQAHPLRRQIEIWKPKKFTVPGKTSGLVGVSKPKGPMGGYANPKAEGKARPYGAGY